MQVVLCLANPAVVMLLIEKRRTEARLPGPRCVDKKGTSGLLGDFIARQPLDQVQAQIQRRLAPAAAKNVV